MMNNARILHPFASEIPLGGFFLPIMAFSPVDIRVCAPFFVAFVGKKRFFYFGIAFARMLCYNIKR